MTNTTNRTLGLLLAALVLGLSQSGYRAQATLVVSNLGETGGALPVIDGSGIAGAFTVGSQNSVLNFATAILSGGIRESVTYHAYIYTDFSGSLGSSLYDLGTLEREVNGPYLNHDFLAPANSMLAASTTYWLVVTPSGEGSWKSTPSENEIGEPGWTIGNTARFVGHSTVLNDVPRFSIDATVVPVPEPSTIIAGALLLVPLSAGLIRRGSRRKA
ncbi:MAG: hypothetical protein L0387_42795 [Acidobacteria bacterium]|nr:hypothetical protein [Acidobacteriota bacterium]